MNPLSARHARRTVASLAMALGMTGAILSCILADPPAELPKLPRRRPTILHASVSPPTGAVLGAFPSQFLVPVDLLDPSLSFQWRVFVDYDPATGIGLKDLGTSSPDPGSADGGLRMISVSLKPPDNLARCHTIELLVALKFVGPVNTTRVPDETGGDSVVWIYNPSGDVSGCPHYDAGPLENGAFPEAGADAMSEHE